MTSGHGLLNFTVRYVRVREVERKRGPVNFRFSKINTSTSPASSGGLYLDLTLPLHHRIRYSCPSLCVCVSVYVRPCLLTRIPLLFLPTRRTHQSSSAVMVHSAPCFLACSAKIQYLLYLNALLSNLLLATAVFDALFREFSL